MFCFAFSGANLRLAGKGLNVTVLENIGDIPMCLVLETDRSYTRVNGFVRVSNIGSSKFHNKLFKGILLSWLDLCGFPYKQTSI